MIHKKLQLPNGTSYLTTYFLDNYDTLDPKRKRPLVLICPGGGYEHLSVREGEAVALKMNSYGFQAAILTYKLAPMKFPEALVDLAEAVHLLRTNAKEFHIDPKKIIVGGFSAGGHLSACLGCYWDSDLLKKFVPYKPEEIRPNAMMLCYPVITADENFCHKGSIKNVLGDSDFTKEDISLENHVTNNFPPTFMWHTTEDKSVPVENTLLFAMALRKAKVPFEYHLFEKGQHGLALATKETSVPSGETVENTCALWPELFKNWVALRFAD